jgi:hypothetical protein
MYLYFVDRFTRLHSWDIGKYCRHSRGLGALSAKFILEDVHCHRALCHQDLHGRTSLA